MNIDTIEEHDNYYHCYDVDDMQQLLNYLEGQVADQDMQIAKGLGKYVNKSWRMVTDLRIKQLKQNIKKEYLK